MKTLTGKLDGARTRPHPLIECYLPAKRRRNGIGLVIFPGGGYGHLAPHEGKGYAEYFSKNGIACFVVTYRLGGAHGHRHPAMLEDALAAVGTIRRHSARLGVDPRRIGVIGSSAGAHLAAHTLVGFGRYERKGKITPRPDFGILCYPVITMSGKYCHKGSRTNLVGPKPSRALEREISCEKNVSSRTPPCFIWHTLEDKGVPVENSMLFAAALKKRQVPFELHVYQKGGHGLGLNASFRWGEDCLRWMKALAS